MPSPVRLMVFRYCFGMIMSVSTLIMLQRRGDAFELW